MNSNRQAFIDRLLPAAMEASQRTGIDPRIIIAQAAHESAWGRSAPGNNYFGIKSHGQEGGQTFTTHEVINGRRVKIRDSFRTYDDPADSVAGYADFMLQNPRYGEFRAASGDLDRQIDALGRSGYATDPNYANAIRSIANSIPLEGFGTGVDLPTAGPVPGSRATAFADVNGGLLGGDPFASLLGSPAQAAEMPVTATPVTQVERQPLPAPTPGRSGRNAPRRAPTAQAAPVVTPQQRADNAAAGGAVMGGLGAAAATEQQAAPAPAAAPAPYDPLSQGLLGSPDFAPYADIPALPALAGEELQAIAPFVFNPGFSQEGGQFATTQAMTPSSDPMLSPARAPLPAQTGGPVSASSPEALFQLDNLPAGGAVPTPTPNPNPVKAPDYIGMLGLVGTLMAGLAGGGGGKPMQTIAAAPIHKPENFSIPIPKGLL